MKRIVAVLAGLLVLPAFAEVAPLTLDDVDISENDTGMTISGRTGQSGATTRVARTTSARTPTGASRTTATPASATRAISTRTGAARGTSSRTVSSRAGSRVSAGNSTGRNTGESKETIARAANIGVMTVSGTTTATAGGDSRIGIRSSVGARVPTIRVSTSSTTVTPTVTTIADADSLAQLSDFCKAQYTECMDNFCNVLDDNEGRCSCSANLQNYAASEAALKKATESLKDVAQKIQYIGLSADDITTLFTETEAELALQNKTDTTKLKSDLDKIKDMIVDINTPTAKSTNDDFFGLGFDLSGLLSFNISSTSFDLSSLFGTTQTTTSNSISNQRGEQLYKTATARCKAAVLNNCENQGVDVSIISNTYDLEIDKECILYERALTEANDNMLATVRNATAVLQRARLMVNKQKNEYNLRECISALDTCMQEEFVCGTDYENCLDPSGKYIVGGEIVVGSMPGVPGGGVNVEMNKNNYAQLSSAAQQLGCYTHLPASSTVYDGYASASDVYVRNCASDGLYKIWNYNKTNAWSENGSLAEYIKTTIANKLPVENPSSMITYLQNKIGYIDKNGRNMGMCMSVLNKCQDYVYTKGKGTKKEFDPENQVITNYLERVSTKIRAAQDEILSDYAVSCISDVSACLTQNGYDAEATSGTKSRIAVGACSSIIRSCRSVNGACTVLSDGNVACDDEGMVDWVRAFVVGYADQVSDMNYTDCMKAGCLWTGSECTTNPHLLTTATTCNNNQTQLGLLGYENSCDNNDCTYLLPTWDANAEYCYFPTRETCTATCTDVTTPAGCECSDDGEFTSQTPVCSNGSTSIESDLSDNQDLYNCSTNIYINGQFCQSSTLRVSGLAIESGHEQQYCAAHACSQDNNGIVKKNIAALGKWNNGTCDSELDWFTNFTDGSYGYYTGVALCTGNGGAWRSGRCELKDTNSNYYYNMFYNPNTNRCVIKKKLD